MELEITWRRVIQIWWAYLWRNLIAIVVSIIIGAIMGFIIGFVMGAFGASTKTIQLVVMPIGFIMGVFLSFVPIKMILGKDFGEFRLVLLSKENLCPHT